MNILFFEELIEEYKNILSNVGIGDEQAKWEFVQLNIGRPNLDTNNLEQEIRNVVRTILIYPLSAGTLIRMASEKPEKLKAILAALYNEKVDLSQRVNNYLLETDALYDTIKNKDDRTSFQEERTIALLLTLFNPGKYTFYKDSIYRKLCDGLGIKPKKKGEKLVHYYEILHNHFSKYVEKDKELKQLINDQLTPTSYPDKSYMLLMQDIIYQVLEGKYSKKQERGIRVWMYAPGENASKWEDFFSSGIAAIGWSYLGDLANYENREKLHQKVNEHTGRNSYNDSKACWEFVNVMQPGDIIIAKKGRSEYIGYGIVESEFIYNEESEYPNMRYVDWKSKGSWKETGKNVVKTLTEITKYSDYVTRLAKLMDINELNYTKKAIEKVSEEELGYDIISYWWLNANPKIWDLSTYPVGTTCVYTTYTDSGTKRRIYKYFEQLKKGDLIIGYETTPRKRVVAQLIVTQGLHKDEDDKECFEFKIKRFYPNQPEWEELQNNEGLIEAEVFRNNQGSLFKLSQEEFSIIDNLATGEMKTLPPYTIADAIEDNLYGEEWLKKTLALWRSRKNIILQGPPGTGKTFLAQRLAWLLMGEKDNSRYHLVQFHPSYSYEDFIEGYRPLENGTFQLRAGHFLKFCRRAEANPNEKFVFVIDEINRGNLSKVFGEVMMGIEVDKRGHKIQLQYSPETAFSIPENIYLIGTMNTADRSLALVDYALRRRFAFIHIRPVFDGMLEKFLTQKAVPKVIISEIQKTLDSINRLIKEDTGLGEGFLVGHSYFCNPPEGTEEQSLWFKNIIEFEVLPLLEEYWFDQLDKLERVKSFIG